MTELLCAGTPTQAVSEFFEDGKVEINGACGVNTAYHVYCVYTRTTPTEAGFQAFLRAMRAAGYCDLTGVTTMAKMVAYLATKKVPLVASQPWTGADQSAHVQHLLDLYAGKFPIMYQTSVGQKLWNELTNSGERARNLQRHFILIVGQHQGGYSPHAKRTLPAGYWVMDGDAFAVSWGGVGPLVFYPVATLAATHPIAAAVVAQPPVVAPKPQPATPKPAPVVATETAAEAHLLSLATVAHYFETVPDPANTGAPAWKCKTNGYVVRAGLLDGYTTEPSRTGLAGLEVLGLPLENERPLADAHGHVLPNTAGQRFERGILVWDPNHTFDRPPGVTSPYYHAHVAYASNAG